MRAGIAQPGEEKDPGRAKRAPEGWGGTGDQGWDQEMASHRWDMGMKTVQPGSPVQGQTSLGRKGNPDTRK